MTTNFEIDLDGNTNLCHYYGEWHVSDKLEEFLNSHKNSKIRLAIEVLSDPDEVEYVTMTYRELYKRATGQCLMVMGLDLHYFNEGGDPTAIIDIPKSIALDIMSEEEFNHRKHDENS